MELSNKVAWFIDFLGGAQTEWLVWLVKRNRDMPILLEQGNHRHLENYIALRELRLRGIWL